MIHEIAGKYRFPAERMASDGRKTIFCGNLRLLDRLKIGFSPDLVAALKDPSHPLSKFFAAFNMGKEMRNRSSAFTETARWLTELSRRFDSMAGSTKIRLMSENLTEPVGSRRFILYFIELYHEQ